MAVKEKTKDRIAGKRSNSYDPMGDLRQYAKGYFSIENVGGWYGKRRVVAGGHGLFPDISYIRRILKSILAKLCISAFQNI